MYSLSSKTNEENAVEKVGINAEKKEIDKPEANEEEIGQKPQENEVSTFCVPIFTYVFRGGASSQYISS